MAINRNKVKMSLNHFPPFILMGKRKIGKTTLMVDLSKEIYGDTDSLVILDMGYEEGAKGFDDVFVEKISHFSLDTLPKAEKELYISEGDDIGRHSITDERTLKETIEDIIRSKDEAGIKMVALDTLDNLVDIASERVFQIHKKQNGLSCKSLNDAMGGYGKGFAELVRVIQEEIIKPLRDAGLAVFLLSHTKEKEKLLLSVDETLENNKYEQITNNLQANIYNPIADSAQLIANVNEVPVLNEKGVVIGTERRIFLRSELRVDCGGRFSDLPDSILLDAKTFKDTIFQAMRSQLKNPISDEEFAKRIIEDNKTQKGKSDKLIAHQEKIKANEENQEKLDELVKEIQEICKKDKTKLALISEDIKNAGKMLSDIEDIELLKSMLKKIK